MTFVVIHTDNERVLRHRICIDYFIKVFNTSYKPVVHGIYIIHESLTTKRPTGKFASNRASVQFVEIEFHLLPITFGLLEVSSPGQSVEEIQGD